MGKHRTKTLFIKTISSFSSEGHNRLIHDCEIVFIGKTDPSDPTRREFFWMRVLKIIAPLGLNIYEGYDY